MLFFLLQASGNFSGDSSSFDPNPQLAQDKIRVHSPQSYCHFDISHYELQLGKCSLNESFFSREGQQSSIKDFLKKKFSPAFKAFHAAEKKTLSMEESAKAFANKMGRSCLDFNKMKPNYQTLCQTKEGFEELLDYFVAKNISQSIAAYYPLKTNYFGYLYGTQPKMGYENRNKNWNNAFGQYVDVEGGPYYGTGNHTKFTYTVNDFTKNSPESFFQDFRVSSGPLFLEAAKACIVETAGGSYPQDLLERMNKTAEEVEELNEVACRKYFPETYFESHSKSYLENLYKSACFTNKKLLLKEELATVSGKEEIINEKLSLTKTAPKPKIAVKETTSKVTHKKVSSPSMSTSHPNAVASLTTSSYQISMPPTTITEMNEREEERRNAIGKIARFSNESNPNELKAAVREYKQILETHKQGRIQDAISAGGTWNTSEKKQEITKFYDDLISRADGFLQRPGMEPSRSSASITEESVFETEDIIPHFF